MTSISSNLSDEIVIDQHPQAELIRLVQRTAYRAYSWRHKQGLDALSWLMGPVAMAGFAMVDDHRHNQSRQCFEAVTQLLKRMGTSIADRRVIAVLLQDYPGRDSGIAALLKQHLQSS
jgi:hypothetical protein